MRKRKANSNVKKIEIRDKRDWKEIVSAIVLLIAVVMFVLFLVSIFVKAIESVGEQVVESTSSEGTFDANNVGKNAVTLEDLQKQSSDVKSIDVDKVKDRPEVASSKSELEKKFDEIYKAEYDGYPELILQTDERWAEVPYATDTIGESGCGLVCASIAIEALTGKMILPDELASKVGDTCLTDDVNDMQKFIDWIKANYQGYGLRSDGIYFNLDKALEDAANDKVVFASLVGYFGDECYDGHIVLLKGKTINGYVLRDPYSHANSSRLYSKEDLESVEWIYFYTLEGLG